MTLSRRSFLRRSAVAGAAGLAGADLAGCGGAGAARSDPSGEAGLQRRVAFDGEHQAGVTAPPAPEATFVALDAIAADRATLVQALQQLSTHSRALTEGYRFGVRDRSSPPPDSGTLGSAIDPDGLTVTIAFGGTLFDERFGLHPKRPPGLTRMRHFLGDDIDDARTHGDVLVSLNAGRRDTVVHAMRELLRPIRGAFAVRWTLDGFLGSDRGPSARSARRNLFGFRDGTSNPSGAERDRLLWLGRDAGWVAGGTFQVVRTIRMHVEFWDRVGLREQEGMIGRSRDTGAPLGGTSEFEDPRLDLDPHGRRIPMDAHIRLANPRTTATADQRILRHAFNYHRGIDPGGQLDQGLLFVAYNANIQRQFEQIQRRLAGEPMTDYVTPVGGGYYFVPRGASGPTDWVGSGLLS